MVSALASFLAGLALFFTGVAGVRERLQQMSGRRVRRMLARVANQSALSTFVGMFCGALTQSASAVAFILSGMVAAGLISLRRALPIVAASNVGTALLVFLAAINLQLAALYVIGICGLAVNFRFAPRWHGLIGALFSIGLLFFGLDLMKRGFEPLPQLPEFQSLAAFLRGWAIAPFILGAACRMFIQSSSAIGVIAITLEVAGIFTETQAMLLICGAGPGVALAVLFLSGNLKGAPRQIVIYQGFINLCAGLLVAALLLADGATGTGIARDVSRRIASDPTQAIALLFLVNMLTCWLIGIASLPWIERMLNRIEPLTVEEDLSRPAFIHDEALEVPETAINLVECEQRRYFDHVVDLLDCVRSDARSGGVPPETLHAGMEALFKEVSGFVAELVHRPLDMRTSRAVLDLERRQEHLHAIEENVHQFVKNRRSMPGESRAAELVDRIAESASFILLTARDAWAGGDATDIDLLLRFTADRGEMMEQIRADYQAAGDRAQQSAVFYATTLFERLVWLVRQLGLGLPARTD